MRQFRMTRRVPPAVWMIGLILSLLALAVLAQYASQEVEAPASPIATTEPAARPDVTVPAFTPTPTVTGPFRIGVSVEIANTGGCLRIRTEPGTSGAVLSCQGDGFIGQITEGPVDKDGFRWWHLVRQQPYQVTGWAAEEFLLPKGTQ